LLGSICGRPTVAGICCSLVWISFSTLSCESSRSRIFFCVSLISERSDARAGASTPRLVIDRTTSSKRFLIFAVNPLGCSRRSQYKRSVPSKVKCGQGGTHEALHAAAKHLRE